MKNKLLYKNHKDNHYFFVFGPKIPKKHLTSYVNAPYNPPKNNSYPL